MRLDLILAETIISWYWETTGQSLTLAAYKFLGAALLRISAWLVTKAAQSLASTCFRAPTSFLIKLIFKPLSRTTLVGHLAIFPIAVTKVFIKTDRTMLDVVCRTGGVIRHGGVKITPRRAHKVIVFATLWADNYPIRF